MWSSSGAASAGCSPPAPSSGPTCGSPSSTGPTTISSSPCCTRWPPGSSRRARSRRPSATCCGTIRPCAPILGEVEHVDVEARAGPRRRVRQTAHHRLRQPHRRRRRRRAPTSVTTSSSAVSCGMKSLDDALALRGNIFGSFELAEAEKDPEKRRRLMTFVVVGGGPTGVEMLGPAARALAAGAPAQLPHDRPRRHPRRAGGGPGPARRVHGDLPVAHDRSAISPAWASRSTSAPW